MAIACIYSICKSFKELLQIEKELIDWLYSNGRLKIRVHPDMGTFQQAGESDRDFIIRLQQASREHRDEEVDKLEKKYAKQLDKMEEKLRKLGRRLSASETDYEGRKREEMLGIGGTALGFFLGRRSTSSLGTIARRRRMSAKAKMKVEETKEEISELKDNMTQLDNELKEAVEEITRKFEDTEDNLITEELRPRRTDVDVQLMALAWSPFWVISFKDGRSSRTIDMPAYPQLETI